MAVSEIPTPLGVLMGPLQGPIQEHRTPMGSNGPDPGPDACMHDSPGVFLWVGPISSENLLYIHVSILSKVFEVYIYIERDTYMYMHIYTYTY